MNKVIAVVVTYNRRALLTECIDALRKQSRKVDQILIVNNGSTDDTQAWVESQSDLQLINQTNVGSGGGFNTGIKWAFEKGYSWIWLMDDDGYPQSDALKYLLEDDREELLLRNCAVINKEDHNSFVWKTGKYKHVDEVKSDTVEGYGHPFNGTLLHRRIVERVGLPISNLFLWGDETEYIYRITKRNSIPFVTYMKSIHYHPATTYKYKNDWNYETSWKMYYYIRNRFAIMKSQFGNNALILYTMYLLFISAFAARVLLFQKTDKMRKFSFIMWPVKHALTKNYSVTPGYILQKLQEQPVNRFALIENYMKQSMQNVRSLLAADNVSRALREFEKAS